MPRNRIPQAGAGVSVAIRALAGATALGAGTLAYATLVERNRFVLRRELVPVLPTGAEPLRILHVSDLHLMPGQRRKAEWVRALDRFRPDLVVDTGDHIAHPDALDLLAYAMGPLLARPGVFVFGSNDFYRPIFKNPARYLWERGRDKTIDRPESLPVGRVRRLLTQHGWIDLDNRRTTLTVAGRRIDLVGTGDAHIRRDRYADVAGAVDPDADLSIGVTHAPYLRVLDAFHADGYPLVLAGHTHGGQLCVPGIGALVTNSDLDTARVKGLSRHPLDGRPVPRTANGARRAVRFPAGEPDPPCGPTALHVSGGLGTSPFAPVRFGCPPEATVLDLVPRASAAEAPADSDSHRAGRLG